MPLVKDLVHLYLLFHVSINVATARLIVRNEPQAIVSSGQDSDVLPSRFIFKAMGGANASQIGYRFQAQIIKGGKHHCGGIILNPLVILTAAHCFNKGKENIRVKVGEFDRFRNEGTEQERKAGGFYVHNRFSNEKFADDIALIILDSPLTFTHEVYSIPFLRNFEKWAGTVTVSGWGTTDGRSGNSQFLQKVDIPIVPRTECEKAWSTVGDGYLCAGEQGKDACSGDSGGPLSGYVSSESARVVIGVTSSGTSCLDKVTKPGIYTSVGKYTEWIETKMAKHSFANSSFCLEDEEEFFCPMENKCIPKLWVGNGRDDCMDGADEVCPDKGWKCPISKACIDHPSWVCDGDRDCPDGEEEEDCPACSSLFTSTFYCKKDRKCLPGALVCNGKNDCRDGSDEAGCSACGRDKFRCGDGHCIKKSWACDGVEDCYRGEDEVDC